MFSSVFLGFASIQFAFDIETTECVKYIILKPRSSLTKTFFGFVSSGIIDAGYRGGFKKSDALQTK